MQISHSLITMSTRGSLNRSFAAYGRKTGKLLSQAGTHRSAPNPASGFLPDLVASEISAVAAAFNSANASISGNQTAGGALDDMNEKLAAMRSLVAEVQTVTHTAEEIAAYNASFKTLAGEVNGLLANTEFGGKALLGGRDPLVRLTLSSGSITGMDLTNLPDGALGDISLAMSEVGLAKADLTARTNRLGSVIDNMISHSDELSALSNRVLSAESATGAVSALTDSMAQEMFGATQAQANASPAAVLQLLT